MKPKLFIWIDCSYFVGVFDLSSNYTINAAPLIARWTIGKHIDYVLSYFRRKSQLNDWILFKNGEVVKV